jgi:hypothetical protein
MIAGLASAGNAPIREMAASSAGGRSASPAAASGSGPNRKSSRYMLYGVIILAFIAWSVLKSSMRRR